MLGYSATALNLDHLLPPGDDVDEGKLHEGEEDEAGADEEPDVDELDVGHLGQVGGAGAEQKMSSHELLWEA